jgi:hypothetical protein
MIIFRLTSLWVFGVGQWCDKPEVKHSPLSVQKKTFSTKKRAVTHVKKGKGWLQRTRLVELHALERMKTIGAGKGNAGWRRLRQQLPSYDSASTFGANFESKPTCRFIFKVMMMTGVVGINVSFVIRQNENESNQITRAQWTWKCVITQIRRQSQYMKSKSKLTVRANNSETIVSVRNLIECNQIWNWRNYQRAKVKSVESQTNNTTRGFIEPFELHW